MKKTAILSVILVCVVSISMAQFSLSLDWANVTASIPQTSCGAYNWQTGNMLQCQYGAPAVNILSGTDGSDTGSDMNLGGLTLGSLGIFAICVAKDGVVYGGSNELVTDGPFQFVRWADQSAVGVQSEPVDMEFPRQMKARGSGVDTVIAVCGGPDNSPITIMTTVDGINFTVTDIANDGVDIDPPANIKHGIAINDDGTVVYGGEGYGGNLPERIENIEGVWTLSTGFAPDGANLSAPCPMDYLEQYDILLCLDTAASDANLSALDGLTGGLYNQIAIGQGTAAYGYGTIDADETQGFGYFICRETGGSPLVGKFSFPIYVAPTAADMNVWAMYE